MPLLVLCNTLRREVEHTFCGCVCVGACVCVCVSGGMCAYGDRWVSVCGCACMGSSVNDVCVCVCVSTWRPAFWTLWQSIKRKALSAAAMSLHTIRAVATGAVNYFQRSSFYSGNENALYECTEDHQDTMQPLQAMSRTTGSVRTLYLISSLVIQHTSTVKYVPLHVLYTSMYKIILC
jgi:hypothetical protein